MRFVLTFNASQVQKIMLNGKIAKTKTNTKQGVYEKTENIRAFTKHEHVSN